MASIDLGMVTAYAYAVAGGYTGSEQDFEDLLGNIASDLEEIENLSVTVTTLPEGSQATASYNNGVLSLGIPKGDTGATGAEGPEGPTGPTGNGIQSIAKTGTSGNVDTYTITYTNGQATTFTVTNGSVTSVDGQTGDVDLSNKANIDGYYEDLTAGYAENLISNVYDEENVPYNFRTAGGSLDIGSFEYDEVVGGSLAVNQLVKNGNFADNSTWSSLSGTISMSNNELTLTASGANPQLYQDNIPMQTDHKYLVSAAFTTPTATTKTRIDLYNSGGSQGLLSPTAFGQGTHNLQLVFKANYTLPMRTQFFPDYNSSTVGTAYKYKNINIIDLTLMFGTTIADYIYTLEQGQAGAGVAWFKKLFPKSYYPYSTGELKHVQTSGHKMVGFNQWDEEWEVGGYDTNGEKVNSSTRIRSKNQFRCVPNTAYYFTIKNYSSWLILCFYDADNNFISYLAPNANNTFTTPSNAHYMAFCTSDAYGNTYKNDICINLHWDGERDGEYEAYSEHTYPLDSTLVLRGKPYLDSANRLKYDGDIYNPNGTVTRRYGIVDMGTLSWFYETNNQVFYAEISDIYARTSGTPNYAINAKYADENVWLASALTDKKFFIRGDIKRIYVKDTAYSTSASFKSSVSNVYLVYLLATPTTETADTFQSPQSVSNWGTEEYVDARSIPIPVGHNTKYPPDLKAKLETSPNSPDADGDYIVRQTNGVNEYVALSTNATIQNIISRLEALEG